MLHVEMMLASKVISKHHFFGDISLGKELLELHYAEHIGKPFAKELIEFMASGPVVGMILEAPNAVKIVRQMIGNVAPEKAPSGTIRGDFTADRTK